MIFGSQKKYIQKKSFCRILWAVRGDFHIGRWARYFYLRQILDRLKVSPQKILDAGCGTGGVTFFLEKRFPQAIIEGVDILKKDIEECSQIVCAIDSKITFKTCDLQSFHPLEKYDLIVINNVLYAVVDYEKALKNLLACLAPGGFLILQDMDSEYLKQKYGTRKMIHDAVRMGFDPEQLKIFLEDLGAKVIVSKATFGPLGDFAHRFFDTVRQNPFLLNITFQFLLLLVFGDTLLRVKKGSGFLLVFRK